MEVIVAPGGAGKTVELIQRSAETGAIIVCVNNAARSGILKTSQAMGLEIPKPVLFTDLISYYYDPSQKGYEKGLLIDNLDLMLDRIFGNTVLAATFRDEFRINETDLFFRRVK